MSVTIRLEKVKLAVDEMKLAMQLAKSAPDDFIARMLARHVIIRANDFITHVRRLKEPLRKAGFNVKEFHSTKEAYAKNFDEYFRVTRNRLGAHVQDFDFGKRLELWNDIEIKKTEFFAEGAEEIYKLLEAMGILGFVGYFEPPELHEEKFKAFLLSYRLSPVNEYGTEIGTDPLAMTRANTSAMLNLTPPHVRAGQLNLIKRWITSERELLAQLGDFPETARTVKARLITDIVSFFDCLITRPVPASALQYMDGLDTVLISAGSPSSAIAKFLKNYSYENPLDELRKIRDSFGAHLEDSNDFPIAALLSSIDRIDINGALIFYETIKNLFEKICFEVDYLRTHAVDGKRMRGVTAGTPSVIPFDEANPVVPNFSAPPDHNDRSDEAYERNLEAWLTGDSSSKSAAQHYFWNAFCHSEVIETFIEREKFYSGSFRNETHKWKSSSEFILKTLIAEQDDEIVSKILQLLADCRSSDPHLLSEIIIRYSTCNYAANHEMEICYYLGELTSHPHQSVKAYLDERVRSPKNGDIQFHAIFALFKIFIRSEGLIRINQRRQRWSYSQEVGRLMEPMSDTNKLFFSIVFASQFSLPQFGHYERQFSDEFSGLCSTIMDISKRLIPASLFDPISDTLKKLQEVRDFVGVSCLLAHQFKASGDNRFSDQLLHAACNGIVITAMNDQARRHLAICFLRLENYDKSLEIAEDLARRNPDDTYLQIFAAGILCETPDAGVFALREINKIRSHYNLEQKDIETLLSLEKALADGS